MPHGWIASRLNRLSVSRLAAAALLAAALVIVPACNTQRPLPMVWEHGDRAFERADFVKAQEDYSEYLERKPGEHRVQLRMAQTLLELGRPVDAVEYAAIAHDHRPGREEYVATYARALFESGRTEQLYSFLRHWTQERGLVSDYLRLGEYAARLGDPDSAELALLTAARVDMGQNVEPQLALADFYASINDTANAKERLRMALFLDPSDEGIRQRLRAMGEIPGPTLSIVPAEAPAGDW